ncbi:MAG: translocation/assembly module TamB domain-containing protein, partial [Syntrophales bacterium]
VTPTAQAPLLALRLTAAELDLSPELNAPTNLSGTITLTGTPELYQGKLKLANEGKGWQAAHLSGLFQGNSEGITVNPLTGSLLAGSVQGSLDFNWGQEVSLKGTVHGRNLNPARIYPDWTGLLNFDLLGGIAWQGQTQPRGEVSGKLLESRLHGQALTGEVRADFARGDLRVERLVLRGKGFNINAAGSLGERLAFNAQSDQLGRLIPQAAGKLQADGWVQRQNGRLEVAIAGRGSNLAVGGLRIAAANLTARFGTEKAYPLHVTAKLRKAAYGRFQVDSLTVKTDGTTLQHTIHAALSSAGAKAQIALAGAYDHGSWGGKIIDLSGRDSVGPWSIESPSPLSVTAGRVVLAPLILTGARPERIEIGGELTEKPLGGSVQAAWAGLNLARVNPWLPREFHLEGSLTGSAAGKILPGRKVDFSGKISLAQGKFRWQKDGDATVSEGKIHRLKPEGEFNLNLRSASVSWDWQGEALRGAFSLALMERGQARGSFQLPIPARHPVTFDRQGPLLASLTGQVLEKGLLSSLFPGLIRESRGELDVDLRIGGTWDEPTVKGNLKLAKTGAYLPTAGIHVSDVQLAMQLEKDTLRIVSFRALSGPGHIEGTALLRIKQWRVASYSGRIDGERFQLVYLPELQIMGSPHLTFDGTMEKLAIRGEMRLPELLIFGPPTRAVVLPSPDVILEGAPQRAEKTAPLALDVNVRLALGERVLAKVEGIDARLEGGIDVIFQNLDKITSKGEIKVAKGRYRAYGVDLEIVRGRLFYAGGPINQPTLDILALRTVGPVRAGVTVAGNLRAPLINLYSEPAMPDVDILAYIVFGRPLGRSNDEQAGMMAQVASILLSKGQSVVLQEQIKNRLGLSTLELRAGGTEATAGYKPIPAAPPGVTGTNQAAGVSQTMLTVGKYLTPQLYFSYGRSLFTGSNLFRLRYDLFKRWQIETQTGNESGVDLYYKIEFD